MIGEIRHQFPFSDKKRKVKEKKNAKEEELKWRQRDKQEKDPWNLGPKQIKNGIRFATKKVLYRALK